MVNFFTSYLGGTHGSAKSAQDFLKALLASAGSVRVISPNQQELPDALFGIKLAEPEWFTMPKCVRLPRPLLKTRRHHLREWIDDQVALYKLKEFSEGGITIVNGWASYEDWRAFRHNFAGPKVMIVRESQRHFSGRDKNHAIPPLLNSFAEFDSLIFVSERGCNEWRQHDEISKIPYVVLPNCCEEEEVSIHTSRDRNNVREEFGFKQDDFVILCPGTIEHRKGQDLLLHIVPDLMTKIPSLKILLVGDPDTKWGHELLEGIPKDLMGNVIHYWHTRPGIMDILYASDLLVFPSRAEALPRTVLEAMVMKTPVVASAVDGIPELVDDGQSGLLFPSDDKEGLLKAVIRLFDDKDLMARMAASGYERYWAIFSRRHQFDRMGHVLENIIRTCQAERVE